MLRIAYDGSGYVGWQKQDNGLAVEEVINKALRELTGEEIAVIGASRTDSGVHALDNVAVFDTESRIPGDKISYALNSYLPQDIVVQNSCETDPDFHPRYAECRKTYEYTIYNADHANPLLSRYSHFEHHDLNVDKMNEAAACLVGEHDFAAFCSAGAQVRTTVRTVYGITCSCTEADDCSSRIIRIRICGDGFLYNMVRIIAGTLIRIGQGLSLPGDMERILVSCDRSQAGPTAPAQGLVLKKIEYTGQR